MSQKKAFIIRILLVLIVISIPIVYAATGTPSSLIVRTDANNSLIVVATTQVNPVTSGVFSSRTLRTDASGNLQVILGGTVTPTFPISIPASTCAAPSLGLSGAVTTGIAFTATPSILNCITGVAVTTLTSTELTSTVPFIAPVGSVTAPGYAFAGATNWGWFTNIAGGSVSLAIAGATTIVTDADPATSFRSGSNATIDLGRTDIGWRNLYLSAAAGIYYLTQPLDLGTAPSIASGGCTSPAITHNNGTAGFLITIGTSCTGVKSITLTMPAAAHFWACDGNNNTSDAAQATNYIISRATTTTAVILTSYDRATGITEDFTASDTYLVKCRGE